MGANVEYYFTKKISASFDDAIERLTEASKGEGFGVLTEVEGVVNEVPAKLQRVVEGMA